MNTNPFQKYTQAITDSYTKTAHEIEEAQKRPSKRVYNSIESLLEECFFLGATKFGNNYIC